MGRVRTMRGNKHQIDSRIIISCINCATLWTSDCSFDTVANMALPSFMHQLCGNPRKSAPLEKVNSTYMKHKIWPRHLVAPTSPVHRARYSTHWDWKGWPGSEIQLYYGLNVNPLYFRLLICGNDTVANRELPSLDRGLLKVLQDQSL